MMAVLAVAAMGLVLAAERQVQNQRQEVRLRQENELLRSQLARLEQPAQQPAQPEVDAGELERLRQRERELLQLRGEVTRLRRQLPAASNMPTGADFAIRARLLSGATKAAEADHVEMEHWVQKFFADLDQKIAGLHAQDLRGLAETMVATNPVAAIEYAKELRWPEDVRPYLDSVFAAWAAQDTEAALNWVDQQVSDPGEREADLQAIRSAAPVGIGAELRQDGDYAVINRLVPGSAADTDGQLQAGDRIVGVAQGDGAFVDARRLPLKDLVQMIRGGPGTPIQLQVLPAGAPLDSAPITVTLTRDQLKLKR